MHIKIYDTEIFPTVLYGYKRRSAIPREQHRLRVRLLILICEEAETAQREASQHAFLAGFRMIKRRKEKRMRKKFSYEILKERSIRKA
jgi:hypothetical protein